MTTPLVRIPLDIEREVRKIQEEFRIRDGVDISFAKAMKIWERRIKRKENIRSGWRFPEFT